ncbi:Piso0_003913 [Millerozyma farinosa CBS 7064]|uniref:Piso0_003913 protein n=1 Tax=Pichia sorbitophila (strain ATCC MYA-4447 / BCRC 22081 / CBS 7064 / NBRC 10061 / NRRL Y-12695) TaxID=559304 RepID=G8Y6Y9_PICSO|nr:Piso0_003913 [Millerozyma farinosa CBS 7064]CCE84369.1 Piso0_003913 [Millerozyma farinosa CBS 7064]
MASIDPADYVEAQDDSKSLRFGDEKQQAKFELGVCMAIYKWEELETAVVNSWGGPKSSEKRDWISGITIDLFESKVVDVALIEETLLYAMFDEFETQVDNDSALYIADLIIKIYRQVSAQDYKLVDELYEKWQAKQNSKQAHDAVNINPDPQNPDSSDDESDNMEDVPALTEGVKNIDVAEPQGPIVDDDGFELVQKKGKQRRN